MNFQKLLLLIPFLLFLCSKNDVNDENEGAVLSGKIIEEDSNTRLAVDSNCTSTTPLVLPVGDCQNNLKGAEIDWTGFNNLGGVFSENLGHLGLDFYALPANSANTANKPVYSIANGTVYKVFRRQGSWRDVIIIRHQGLLAVPVFSMYGHILAENNIAENGNVTKGQMIGHIHSDPDPYDPHLHLEIKNLAALMHPACCDPVQNLNCYNSELTIGKGYACTNNFDSDSFGNYEEIRYLDPPRFDTGYQGNWYFDVKDFFCTIGNIGCSQSDW